jgi:hypothetical protein
MACGDYNCLTHGLKKAGREDLLPPKPKWLERPLAWWMAVRHRLALGSSDLSLALGNLYGLIFPEDPCLLHRWHNAGADVHMTIRLINAYFCRVKGISIPGKIDAYFPPVHIGDMAAESGTSLETRDTEIRDESIENLDTGDNELMATLNGQDELDAEGDNTGDGIEGSDLEDIGSMEDSDQEGEGCFDESYDIEDCESESEADAYMEDAGHEDDLDYMEVC